MALILTAFASASFLFTKRVKTPSGFAANFSFFVNPGTVCSAVFILVAR
jgi:hypothetical protein